MVIKSSNDQPTMHYYNNPADMHAARKLQSTMVDLCEVTSIALQGDYAPQHTELVGRLCATVQTRVVNALAYSQLINKGS